MENCVFCQIVRGASPASVVYADEQVLAVMDIKPVNPGHTLVIPKLHAARLSDLSEETGGRMFKAAMRISNALTRCGVKCEGINLMLADGEVAGQEVFHVHIHVIPRFTNDGFRLKFGPNYGVLQSKRELDKIALDIRTCLR